MKQLIFGIIYLIALLGFSTAATAKSYEDISYLPEGSSQQTLDIHTPNKGAKKGLPVLVYIHGGAWMIGDKALRERQTLAYTRKGIIVVSVNYRLAPGQKYPANINDIYVADKWLRRNIGRYGGDRSNMVLVGHSAGAHLVALAGVGPRGYEPLAAKYKAVMPVDTAAYDLTKAGLKHLPAITQKARLKTFKPVNYRAASPLYQIDLGQRYNPFHLFVAKDRPEAVGSTAEFLAALHRKNKPAHLTAIPEASHRDLNKMIFQRGSIIYDAITAALGR